MAKSYIDNLDSEQARDYESLVRECVRVEGSSSWLASQATKRFGRKLSRSGAMNHMNIIKDGGTLCETRAESQGEKVESKATGTDTQELEVVSGKVRTVEDALKKAGVDQALWAVDRFVINSWEVGAKGPDKKICVTPLWQVKVWLKAKNGWSPAEMRSLLVEDIRVLAPSYRAPAGHVKVTAPLMAELSIFDAHFGKMAWKPETGQDYDLKICRDRYMGAAHDLMDRAAELRPERLVYVVGNDFFHTDQGRSAMTSNGTPQDCDGRWQKAFRYGTQCAITVAEEASQICPVDIVVVPGNHDAEKAFCLGEILNARFHENENINVQNEPDVHAYYRWGKILLGFVHGDNHGSDKKRSELLTVMSTDRPQDWAETTWREWHLGHFHSEMEEVWKYRKVKHERDIAVRVLPSLSSTDAWHRRSGYKSVLAAECHIYHKEKGRYQYMVHTVDGD